MVQKLGNNIEYLNSKKQITINSNKTNTFLSTLQQLKDKSLFDLLSILKTDKNKTKRQVVVYLLGKRENVDHTIIQLLREMLAYESSDIRKEIIWTLAKFGDESVQNHLLKLIEKSADELEITISVRLLGRIGDKEALPILLQLFTTKNSTISYSAIVAINELIEKEGIESIYGYLQNSNRLIRLATIWILGLYCYQNEKNNNKKKTIELLLFSYEREKDEEIKLATAYFLTLLNSIEGVKRLLTILYSNKIPTEQKTFYWNEIIRFFVYKQKQSSLNLFAKINHNLNSTLKQGKHTELFSDLLKLKKMLSDFDKIFDYY